MATLSSAISGSGFHFAITTTVSIPASPDAAKRKIHLVHDLDPHVYADQYELAQRPGYSAVLWGTTDLEKPVSAVPQNGSVLLLTADTSHLLPGQSADIILEVPLHARYGRPVAGVHQNQAFYRVPLKRPVGFLAEGLHTTHVTATTEMPEVLRPYASLDGWPSPPLSLIRDISTADPLEIVLPVGVLDNLAWVDAGTAVVMITMFFYLMHASVKTARRISTKISTKTE
ncbi:hypothetical protein BD414DRAFT_433285, partial [Trametes punicea]